MSILARHAAAVVLAMLLAAAGSATLSSQTSRSTPEGLRLLQEVQHALGGVTRLAAVRDYEETIRAQAWDAAGNALGEVRKRTRWTKMPNRIRLDQRGPRGTYVMFFDGGSGEGWEILPDLNGPDPYRTTGKAIALAGGELQFATGVLSDFELNQWLADRLPGYVVSSPAANVLSIRHGGSATEFTLDPATNRPLRSSSISLADPDHPVPSETRFIEWKAAGGIFFPTQRAKYMSGLKRGEVIAEEIRINAGLRPRDLAATPVAFAPEIARR